MEEEKSSKWMSWKFVSEMALHVKLSILGRKKPVDYIIIHYSFAQMMRSTLALSCSTSFLSWCREDSS